MIRVFPILFVVLLSSCGAPQQPEVFDALDSMYPPHENRKKVVYSSLIRALGNLSDTADISGITNQIEKVYYFSVSAEHRSYDSTTTLVIDSLLKNERYEPIGELYRDGEDYSFFIAEKDKSIAELVIFRTSDREILLLDVIGEIELDAVLSNLNNLDNLTQIPMLDL